jgi:predicted kinase
MKVLILTRGAPGSGKTTFLSHNGLSRYVISPDSIRAQLGGVEVDSKGEPQIGYFREDDVWREVKLETRERMEDEEPVIIDATFQVPKHLEMPLKLANQFKYKPLILDFTGIPMNVSVTQNALRKGWERVPEEVIENAYANFKRYKISGKSKIEALTPDQFSESELFSDLKRLAL